MTKLEVGDLKSLREALCVAQSAIGLTYSINDQNPYVVSKLNKIQEVLDQIDILRPLGPDGKHGNRHTEHCGCEDNPYLDLLSEWRVIQAFPMYELSGGGNIRVATTLNSEEHGMLTPITARYGVDDKLEYELLAHEDGYFRSYVTPVSFLLKVTFPELNN
jgi:hypothetical protein